MKDLMIKLLLLFCKQHSRTQSEGGFKYKIHYKRLFDQEYIIYKALPPICLKKDKLELPFDSFVL